MLLYIFDNQKTLSKTEDAIAGTTNLGVRHWACPALFSRYSLITTSDLRNGAFISAHVKSAVRYSLQRA